MKEEVSVSSVELNPTEILPAVMYWYNYTLVHACRDKLQSARLSHTDGHTELWKRLRPRYTGAQKQVAPLWAELETWANKKQCGIKVTRVSPCHRTSPQGDLTGWCNICVFSWLHDFVVQLHLTNSLFSLWTTSGACGNRWILYQGLATQTIVGWITSVLNLALQSKKYRNY